MMFTSQMIQKRILIHEKNVKNKRCSLTTSTTYKTIMENILICGIVILMRTGTTSLLQSLSKDKEIIHEPFNYPLPRFQKKKLKYPSDFWDLKNTVVKSIYYQKPEESKLDNFLFYVEFSKYFDKIILLDRKNFQEHLLSCINLQAKIRNKVLYNEEKGKYKFYR